MQKKFKLLILITAAMGALAVIMGAFGSHLLAEKLDPKSLNAYKTGVNYHYIHTMAIFCTALLYRIYRIKGLFYIGLYFLFGILLFSGSLYLLAMKDILGISSTKFLGPLTPLGGLALIGSWAAIFFTVIRIKT
ncbi:MAG: DUF423 domain-containing protein [Saprospiraceae bacterium]|nr:DUF423 domain-containing protein [Bacteroidia bacterium]NNE13863.1 DUF423 domain-containing protein [Saprospiraceae bacterium]NNL91791.1 DUF423 domain-containing protein [Saprospiraceae bacterium]